MKTQLHNRILWYDGTNEINPDKIVDFLLNGVSINKLVITESSTDVQCYNNLSDTPIKEGKLTNDTLSLEWNIPDEFLQLDLQTFILTKVTDSLYVNRANEELALIKKLKLENLFKCIIYVVHTFKQNNTIWGIGRGSSCASLVLFLIGLHKVDPVKYNIPLSEFFH